MKMMPKREDREFCLLYHRRAVEMGFYITARRMLRRALIWRDVDGRKSSALWTYPVPKSLGRVLPVNHDD